MIRAINMRTSATQIEAMDDETLAFMVRHQVNLAREEATQCGDPDARIMVLISADWITLGLENK